MRSADVLQDKPKMQPKHLKVAGVWGRIGPHVDQLSSHLAACICGRTARLSACYIRALPNRSCLSLAIHNHVRAFRLSSGDPSRAFSVPW